MCGLRVHTLTRLRPAAIEDLRSGAPDYPPPTYELMGGVRVVWRLSLGSGRRGGGDAGAG
jgi:hypothetical protein